MKIFLVVIFSVALLVYPGCGEGGDGGPICEALVGCGVLSSEDCILFVGSTVFSQECEDAMLAATCEDHALPDPSYTDLCFPPCDGDFAQCSGSQIIVCSDGHRFVMKCDGVCQLNNMAYIGVCADEYQGQQSDTGGDVCWCSS
jgi:hypothetical protein